MRVQGWIVGALLAGGCGYSGDVGGVGVSVGGVQDIGLAREIIASGGIPSADSFTAEGLFSEHDLRLDAELPCEVAICPVVGTIGVEPIDGSGPQTLVQLGFDSAIEEVVRGPLALSLVVDVSASMGGTKIDDVRRALRDLAGRLDDRDQVSVTAFSTRSEIRLPLTRMDADGLAALDAVIDGLRPLNATDLEEGLADGYAALDGADVRLRPWLMLFTDALPNVGATGPRSFQRQVADHQDTVGLSVFGVGMDLGTDLFEVLAETRNANGFSLFGPEVRAVFEDLDLYVTPIAQDFELSLAVADGAALDRAFGAPSERPDGVTIGARTLFASRNEGAIALRLDAPDATLGELTVSFVPEGAEPVATVLSLSAGGEPQVGPRRLAVLVDEIEALEAGAAMCRGELVLADAVDRVREARNRLQALGEELGDEGLLDEASLMDALRDNLQDGDCR